MKMIAEKQNFQRLLHETVCCPPARHPRTAEVADTIESKVSLTSSLLANLLMPAIGNFYQALA